MTNVVDISYDFGAAATMAAALRTAATAVSDQASTRARLKATLLDDCWQGRRRQDYDSDYATQCARAAHIRDTLTRLAATIESMSAQAQSDQRVLQAKRTADEEARQRLALLNADPGAQPVISPAPGDPLGPSDPLGRS